MTSTRTLKIVMYVMAITRCIIPAAINSPRHGNNKGTPTRRLSCSLRANIWDSDSLKSPAVVLQSSLDHPCPAATHPTAICRHETATVSGVRWSVAEMYEHDCRFWFRRRNDRGGNQRRYGEENPARLLNHVQVDAFTSKAFGGNSAAVVLLEDDTRSLPDETLQAIAMENNLSETAYIQTVEPAESAVTAYNFRLRWFTPSLEVKLCGHATLAAATALWKCE